MMKITFLLVVLLVIGAMESHAADPRNESECISMTREPMKAECRRIFSGAEQAPMLESCLSAIDQQLEVVCKQFFGEGKDFCAVCTKSCTDNFQAGNSRRKECLAMCLDHPGCQ